MKYLAYMLVVSLFLLIVGCDSKESIPKSSEVVTTKPEIYRFEISDIDRRRATVTIEDGELNITKVKQSIVVLNIFASWSPACRGLLPYLGDLQQRYSKEVFIVGVAVNSDLSDESLREFMNRYKLKYFISNSKDNSKLASTLVKLLNIDSNYPIPLTVIFENGLYITHYIGATPVEMIRSDIEQLRRR